jgi:hypothetical protein
MMHADISQPIQRPLEELPINDDVPEVQIPDSQASNRSKVIENWLREENKLLEQRRKGIKILLLGE